MSSADSANQHEQANASLGYKEQLDEAAKKVKNPENSSANEGGGLLEQAAEKAAGKILGRAQDEATPPPPPPQQATSSKVPGPPERPDHDVQIEEFVRDQHRSKAEDGTLLG